MDNAKLSASKGRNYINPKFIPDSIYIDNVCDKVTNHWLDALFRYCFQTFRSLQLI